MSQRDIDAASPGHLEKTLHRRDVTPSSVIDSLNPKSKSDIADACAWIIVLHGDPRFASAVRVLFDEYRRTLRLKNDADLDQQATQRLRGQIDGVTLAESLLTSTKTLAETRRQMLGLPDEDAQGVADA